MVRYYLSVSYLHAPELMALSRIKGFRIRTKIKEALRAYVYGTPYAIEIPQDITPQIKRCGRSVIEFTLDEKKDKDVIDFIESLEKGERSFRIKQIVAAYYSDNVNRILLSKPDKDGHKVVFAGVSGQREDEAGPGPYKEASKDRVIEIEEDPGAVDDIAEFDMDSSFDLFAASESLMGEM